MSMRYTMIPTYRYTEEEWKEGKWIVHQLANGKAPSRCVAETDSDDEARQLVEALERGGAARKRMLRRRQPMSYYVVRNPERGEEGVPYAVRRFESREEMQGIVESFRAQWTGPVGRYETEGMVQDRAQAYCDQLNAGGVSREQALREAEW